MLHCPTGPQIALVSVISHTTDELSSLSVNLGHIFALRPRVNTAFTPLNLNTAKHFLKEEKYASQKEAVRAVAEKALELNHEGGSKRGTKHRK